MAFATANDSLVIRGTIGIPRAGAWHADLRVDAESALSGAITLKIADGLTLVGTAAPGRTGVWLDTASLRMVGGAGGLANKAKPRHYRKTALRSVLGDILATAGERLAPTSSASILDLTFLHWATIGQACGRMISALLGDSRLPADVAWRVLPDGTVWVGVETWPASPLANVVDYQDLDESPSDGWMELGVEAPSLLPGMTLAGRRVSYVEHLIDGATARTRVWLEG